MLELLTIKNAALVIVRVCLCCVNTHTYLSSGKNLASKQYNKVIDLSTLLILGYFPFGSSTTQANSTK